MKKIRLFLIYGIIGVLCIAALTGFIINWSRNSGTAEIAVAKSTPIPTGTAEIAAAESTPIATGTADIAAAKSTPIPTGTPEEPLVGIAQGDDYAATTKKAIENAGGLGGIITKDCTVLIKPNICKEDKPGSPTITDYRVVEEVVKEVKELGAAKVIVAEGPISGLAFTRDINGYQNLKDVEFVEFNKMSKEDCYEVKPENSVTGKSFFIPKIYMDADVVIGVPKLKTHFQPDAYVSLCLKNLFGVAPGRIYGGAERDSLHNLGLMQTIVDLNLIRKPDFQVVDGIVGGEGYGPINNTPVDSKIILAGVDPVAVDMVGLTFMGFTEDQVLVVRMAANKGVGVDDLSKIKVVGADLDKIKMKFSKKR